MRKRRTNPFRGFLDLVSEMNRIRELGRTGGEPEYEERPRTHANAWVPNADMFAKGEDLVIRLELAGVYSEDIEVSLQENVLTISGERISDLDEETTFYVHERAYGAFRRSMTVAAGIDERHISAEFENGTLQLTIRGGAAIEPRRIEVRDRTG